MNISCEYSNKKYRNIIYTDLGITIFCLPLFEVSGEKRNARELQQIVIEVEEQ